jgi:hypothetical protein
VPHHEGHRVRGYQSARRDQIALVLAFMVIGDYDQPT